MWSRSFRSTHSSGLLDNGYDYYECIRILENDTNEMQAYLQNKQESYPDFRSSRTGYTYADLCDIYTDFKKYTIPELYAYVLQWPAGAGRHGAAGVSGQLH